MREIKFRAWDIREKHMYYTDISDYPGQCTIILIILPYTGFFGTMNAGRGYVTATHWQKITHETYVIGSNGILMQYTGLKDINGKEIYEGDRVCDHRIEEDNVYTVRWSDSCGGFVIDLEDEQLWNILEYLEIIGNIYENPEMQLKTNAE